MESTLLERYSLEYHRTLNRKLFNDDDVLLPDVRNAFLRIARAWMDAAKIHEDYVTDIIFTGGNCNYNYSSHSDCDVHVVYDQSKFTSGLDVDHWKDYLDDKKSLWAKNHHITVRGYTVELFAQSSDDNLVASGVYSLTRNDWIKKPVHGRYHFSNDPALIKKVEETKKTLDTMIKNDVGSAEFTLMKQKLKAMRNGAMASGDEFTFDNLVFKALRNTGALDRMNAYLGKHHDQELSL
jgi:hypothetical protein